jgi:apolipoprotein N-acyltransferase
VREAVSFDASEGVKRRRVRLIATHARASVPTFAEAFRAVAAALLLLLAFPDFDLWPLAWVALVPLLYAVASRPRAPQSFLTGWLAGTVFFYASCHWLTFPMIRYAEFPAWLAHVLLLAPALAGGFFVGLFAGARARVLALGRACAPARAARLGRVRVGEARRHRSTLERARLLAGVPTRAHTGRALRRRLRRRLPRRLRQRRARVRAAASRRARLAVSLASLACVALALFGIQLTAAPSTEARAVAVVVALQPNVVPDFDRAAAEYDALAGKTLRAERAALRKIDESGAVGSVNVKEGEDCGCGFETPHVPARVVVWPESPMNFSYEQSDRAARARRALR